MNPWSDAETGESLTEDELCELALSADPDAPVPDDAVPIDVFLAGAVPGPLLLPTWYMPPALARGARWRVPVVLAIVAAFLIIEAFGLCSTYGPLSLP